MTSKVHPIVHVVEDDVVARRSLDRLLRSKGYKTFIYETPQAILEIGSSLPSGCILLDFYMPAMDGLEFFQRLISLDVLLPVIALTRHGDVQTVARAMKAGVFDFLETSCSDEQLLAAIDAALADERHPRRDREIIEAVRRVATLSPREREVLEALTAGQSHKEIAHTLGISVRTVEVHRSRMLRRLGTRRLPEAIRLSVIATLVAPAAKADFML
jgi:two-component system response regulator FixJ